MFGKITGQRLMLAKLHIANYILDQIERSGGGDIGYMVSRINSEFRLVPELETNFLISDISYLVDALNNQTVDSIDRGGYWKFRAMSALDATQNLRRQLEALAD